MVAGRCREESVGLGGVLNTSEVLMTPTYISLELLHNFIHD